MPGRTRAAKADRGGRGWWVALLVMVIIAGLLVAAGFFVLSKFTHLSLFNPAGCTFSDNGTQVSLALDQTQDASVIAAVGQRLGVPAFGIEVAEATALQESKLENIDYGDRDSVGLFQQRPSQGWGTSAQILDPVYASTKFFQALTKVSNWQTLTLADAAQAVQHSADGSAYASHEQEATVLATVFTGAAGSGLSCTLDGPTFAPQTAGANGLTAQSAAYSAAFQNQLGSLSMQNVSAGGSAFDIPVPGSTETTGWSYANWSVAQAESLGVVTVTYDGKTWSAAQGSAGWQSVANATANTGEVQIGMTTTD